VGSSWPCGQRSRRKTGGENHPKGDGIDCGASCVCSAQPRGKSKRVCVALGCSRLLSRLSSPLTHRRKRLVEDAPAARAFRAHPVLALEAQPPGCRRRLGAAGPGGRRGRQGQRRLLGPRGRVPEGDRPLPGTLAGVRWRGLDPRLHGRSRQGLRSCAKGGDRGRAREGPQAPRRRAGREPVRARRAGLPGRAPGVCRRALLHRPREARQGGRRGADRGRRYGRPRFRSRHADT
jgi:hypothetical protein